MLKALNRLLPLYFQTNIFLLAPNLIGSAKYMYIARYYS